MQKFGPQEFRDIDAVLDRCFGGSPEENRRPHLEIAFHSRMRSTRRGDLAVYLTFLQEDEHEQGALASLLTVGETYFFRTEQHFDALRDIAIPELLRMGRKRIRMLSAACASGEEAYSMAMVATMAHLAPAVEIEGIDVNPVALEKARAGMYTDWSLRSTTPAVRDRFFKKTGRQWQIDDAIRSAVHFQAGNLMALAPEQFTPGKNGERNFDVIFCRNALIYFKHHAIVEAVHRLCALLRPGGYLFLGPTETLRGISRSFTLCHTHGTFYYRLHHCGDDRREFSKAEPDEFAALTFPAPHLQPVDTSIDTAWFDEIQRSAERVEAMAPSHVKKKSAGKSKLTREKTLLDVLTLIEADDMTSALKSFEQLPEAEQTAMQSRMVRAALLMQTGKREEAVELAREAIREDDLNAEAHYLLSLGLEETAPEESRKHAETAAYLAPNFAMAQVRLGMMQAQTHETELAQASFKSAVEALGTEDRRRLALFGGGFSAAGLRAMCESELRGMERRK
ncbi:MAG: methyltransferase domain-containing protein [Acidobacteria bacterium]|nr:methyltransferase domain-containing protein [Acidobacteriota bacterium]